jgi:hypothetical protein
MRDRSSERGNTVLIATVLILGMTVLSLGVMRYVQRHARDSADMKFEGYPGTQALYAAEMGVNALLFENNTASPSFSATPSVPTAFQAQRTISYPSGNVTQEYGYDFTDRGMVAGNYRFDVKGSANRLGSTDPSITRTVRVDLASGSVWSLVRYEQNPE